MEQFTLVMSVTLVLCGWALLASLTSKLRKKLFNHSMKVAEQIVYGAEHSMFLLWELHLCKGLLRLLTLLQVVYVALSLTLIWIITL